MNFTMKDEGLVEVSRMISELGSKAAFVASHALFEGAGVMANEINSQAKMIQSEKFHYAVFPSVTNRLPSTEEKDAVVNAGAGIARFQKDGGEVQTSVGYSNAGYTTIAGRVKPIPQIANAINSGTSFMQKQPFVRKGVSKGKKAAVAAIVAEAEKLFNAIISQNEAGGISA